MARRIFVSDIHMSTGLSFDDSQGRYYDWLKDDQAGHVLDFLEYVAQEDAADELILAGDIFDAWVYPIGQVPPQYSEIGAARENPKIIEKLRTISESKKVTYLVGNHDMTITKDSILDFGNGKGQNVVFQQTYESLDGVFSEHGNRFGMYNAWDPKNELPLGHYISRLQASKDAETESPPARWQDSLRGALAALTRPNLDPYVNAPLNYFRGALSINDSKPILKAMGGQVTLGDLREIYADLPHRWIKSNGLIAPLESALEETPNGLDDDAEYLAKAFGKKLVVFGHTHDAKIGHIFREIAGPVLNQSDFVAVAIYANCGSWCQENAEYAYVVDEYDEGTKKHTVTLKRWLDKAYAESLTI